MSARWRQYLPQCIEHSGRLRALLSLATGGIAGGGDADADPGLIRLDGNDTCAGGPDYRTARGDLGEGRRTQENNQANSKKRSNHLTTSRGDADTVPRPRA